MATAISALTLEDLGDGTELDLTAFTAACRNYRDSNGCTDAEAIAAIWGNGDFWGRVREWAPADAEAAEEYDQSFA